MKNLAINGAAPVAKDGEYKYIEWPPVNESTAEKVKQLYLSRKWSFNSEEEQKFEKAYAAHHGAKHGVFMANGTVTLECAMEVLGIGAGDEVIVPGLTWIATATAVQFVGAKPVFADIDPVTWTLDPAAFEAAITPRTKAVIPVHLYGSIADLEKIMVIAGRHNIAVIEDCAHMQGGVWNGCGVGSWGTIGSFSFQQSKTIGAGEGGICLTNDDKLAELLYRTKHIGYSRYDKQGQAGTPPPEGLRCHNYRGLAIPALILSEQLAELPALLKRYQAFADILKAGVADVEGVRLQAPGRLATVQGYYALGITFEEKAWQGIPKSKIFEAMYAEGARCIGGTYGPVYRHMLFNLRKDEYIMAKGGCPVSDHLCEQSGVIMHYGMGYTESAHRLVEIIRKIANNKGELK